LLTDYQVHEQALQKTIATGKESNNAKRSVSRTSDPEYVLELGQHPDLSTIINKQGSTNSKSILTKYRTSAIMTEAGTTRSIKFGAGLSRTK